MFSSRFVCQEQRSRESTLTARRSRFGPDCSCCRCTVPCPPRPRSEQFIQTSSGQVLPGRECTTPVVENVVGSLKASSEGGYSVAMTRGCVLKGWQVWRSGIEGSGGDGGVVFGRRSGAPHAGCGSGTTHCGAAQPRSSEHTQDNHR